jgi:two-component system sensor histidine kinase/response regulator
MDGIVLIFAVVTEYCAGFFSEATLRTNLLLAFLSMFIAGGITYIWWITRLEKNKFEKEQLIEKYQLILQRKGKIEEDHEFLKSQVQLLEQKHDVLKQSNHTKNQLFKTISEDIRNPLVRLKMKLTELIDDHVEEANFKQAIRELSEMVGDVSLLLENLLQWSKYQSQNKQSKPQSVELTSVVADAVNQQKFGAAEKNITLSNTVEQDLYVYADGEMIKSMLKTILQNTINLLEKNTAIVFSGGKHENRGQIHMSVQGCMPMKNLYMQTSGTENYDSTQSETGKSITLGWMFCRAVVEENNGEMLINEVSPDTLEIFVRFPLAS